MAETVVSHRNRRADPSTRDGKRGKRASTVRTDTPAFVETNHNVPVRDSPMQYNPDISYSPAPRNSSSSDSSDEVSNPPDINVYRGGDIPVPPSRTGTTSILDLDRTIPPKKVTFPASRPSGGGQSTAARVNALSNAPSVVRSGTGHIHPHKETAEVLQCFSECELDEILGIADKASTFTLLPTTQSLTKSPRRTASRVIDDYYEPVGSKSAKPVQQYTSTQKRSKYLNPFSRQGAESKKPRASRILPLELDQEAISVLNPIIYNMQTLYYNLYKATKALEKSNPDEPDKESKIWSNPKILKIAKIFCENLKILKQTLVSFN